MSDAIRFETAAIHAGQDPDPTTGAAVVPIYQTSTYVQSAVGEHKGFEYSRTDNPTRRAFETCLAALEAAPSDSDPTNMHRAAHPDSSTEVDAPAQLLDPAVGAQCLAFASGMAAMTTLAMTLKSGQKVVVSDDVYGGTYRLFSKVMSNLGIEWESADLTDPGSVTKALGDEAGLLVAETPTNPLLKVVDIQMLADAAHSAGAILCVDNTFATPYIQQPLAFGADVVLYSATKYLGGHSDLVMGALVTQDDELAQQLRFLQNSVGAVPGPFDAWLLLRGLKTLALRMRAHSENAADIARYLDEHPAIEKVHFPGLESSPGYEIATKQMSASGAPLYGGMVTVEAKSEEAALDLCRRTKLFFLAESLGGVESLIEHPGQMTHASLAGSGIEVSPALVRLSVGIEHPEDLKNDLAQALT